MTTIRVGLSLANNTNWRDKESRKDRDCIARAALRAENAANAAARALTPVAERRRSTRRQRYEDYLRSPHWIKFRRRLLQQRGAKCEWCGARKRLEVHHLHYRTLGQETSVDVAVLCYKCHHGVHFRKKQLESHATGSQT